MASFDSCSRSLAVSLALSRRLFSANGLLNNGLSRAMLMPNHMPISSTITMRYSIFFISGPSFVPL